MGNLKNIKYILVLMLENRGFDNIAHSLMTNRMSLP